MTRGIEAELVLIRRLERLVPGQEAVDAVDGLTLGVGAVEGDVAQGPLGFLPAFLEPGRKLGLASP